MELSQVIARRHSCRAYTDRALTASELDPILAAAYAAPVGMHDYDSVRLTVVSGEAMEKLRALFAKNFPKDPLYGAKTMVVVSSLDSPVGFLNAGAIIENMMLEAEDRGIASCFIAGCLLKMRDCAELRALLKVPEGFGIASGAIFGFEAGKPAPAKDMKGRYQTENA